MRSIFLLAGALAGALAACPPRSDPGAPSGGSGGGAGAPSSAGAGQGGALSPAGAGGFVPAGAAGAPVEERPLCPLERAGEGDDDLDRVRLELATALVQLGWGNLTTVKEKWLTYRDFSRTVIVVVAPTGPSWGPDALEGRLVQVLHKMPGGGHVEMARTGCSTCGFRSPCPDVPGRISGAGRDVAFLPLRY